MCTVRRRRHFLFTYVDVQFFCWGGGQGDVWGGQGFGSCSCGVMGRASGVDGGGVSVGYYKYPRTPHFRFLCGSIESGIYFQLQSSPPIYNLHLHIGSILSIPCISEHAKSCSSRCVEHKIICLISVLKSGTIHLVCTFLPLDQNFFM